MNGTLRLPPGKNKNSKDLQAALDYRPVMKIANVDSSKTSGVITLDTSQFDAMKCADCFVPGQKLYPEWVVEQLKQAYAELLSSTF